MPLGDKKFSFFVEFFTRSLRPLLAAPTPEILLNSGREISCLRTAMQYP